MPKLLDQVRIVIRLRHYSLRTEQSYVSWIKQHILFSDKRHPAELGAAEAERVRDLRACWNETGR